MSTQKSVMNSPLLRAFFVGRAVAEIFNEQLENALTDALSELGKFDAEARESLRQFNAEVMARANRGAEASTMGRNTTTTTSTPSVDLQAMIDDLRAEIAVLRAELQRYRNNPVSIKLD